MTPCTLIESKTEPPAEACAPLGFPLADEISAATAGANLAATSCARWRTSPLKATIPTRAAAAPAPMRSLPSQPVGSFFEGEDEGPQSAIWLSTWDRFCGREASNLRQA